MIPAFGYMLVIEQRSGWMRYTIACLQERGGDVKNDALRIALPALLAGATLAACAGLPTVSLDDAKAVAAQAALVRDAHGRLPGPGTERLL